MSAQLYWNQIKSQVTGFYEKNKKSTQLIGGGIIAVIALSVFWTSYWHPKREKEAAVKIAKLHHYFETDSFLVVLNGIKGKNMATAPEIADDYWLTQKGKEAALMAGLSYLATEKWEKAIKYLDKTNPKDLILGPSIIAAKATCYAELGKLEKAAGLYESAAEKGKNEFTAQYYKKAGIHFELANEYKSALRCFEKIKTHYSQTPEASDIDKYIYRVKGLLGELNN